MGTQNKRVNEFDCIRVIATLLVVAGHSDFLISHGYNLTNIISDELGAYTVEYAFVRPWIYSFHMPLFMVLSGALFYSSFRKYSVKEYIINRWKRLMVPYAVCGVLFSIPIKYVVGYFYNKSLLYSYVKSLILMLTPGHIWFLWVLFVLELVFSLLYTKLMNLKSISTALIVSILLYYLSGHTTEVFQLHRIFCYPIFFMLGFIFEKYNFRERFFTYFKGLKGGKFAVCMLFLSVSLSVYTPDGGYIILMTYRFFQAVIGIFAIFAFCSVLTKESVLESTIFKKLLNNNFSIYLYHEPLQFAVPYIMVCIDILGVFNSNIMYVILYFYRFSSTIVISIIIGKIVGRLKNILDSTIRRSTI